MVQSRHYFLASITDESINPTYLLRLNCPNIISIILLVSDLCHLMLKGVNFSVYISELSNERSAFCSYRECLYRGIFHTT